MWRQPRRRRPWRRLLKAEVAKATAPAPTLLLLPRVRCATPPNACRIPRRSGISSTSRTTTRWCQRRRSRGAERRSFAFGSTTRRSPRLRRRHRSTASGCSMSVATNNPTICRYASLYMLDDWPHAPPRSSAPILWFLVVCFLLRRCTFLLPLFFSRTATELRN